MNMIETGGHVVRLTCPECAAPVAAPVDLSTVLTVTDDGATLKLRTKSSPIPHVCDTGSQDDLFAEADDDENEDSRA